VQSQEEGFLVSAIEPNTGGSPRRLYFGDEVLGNSKVGQVVGD